MTNEICKSPHRDNSKFGELPDDQGGVGRHKCPGCAYAQGFNDAKNGNLANPTPALWLISQAKSGRHKDPMAAYDLGFSDGGRTPS